jgi:hypothetical protein
MASVEEAAAGADFVLRCTVEQVDASGVAALEASRQTAVVRVEQVLHAPPAVSDLEGAEVTVQLAQAGSLKQGEEVVLSANALLFGESLAVQEVAHHAVSEDHEALAARVGDARAAAADQEMQDRVARANVIVSGRVADVRIPPEPVAAIAAATETGAAESQSEHDPHWREAVITVDKTIKGEPPAETTVLFPASEDVAWVGVPKLAAGQEGVFLLHRNVEVPQLATAAAAEAHTALSPLDVLPKEEEQRVQRLVGQS